MGASCTRHSLRPLFGRDEVLAKLGHHSCRGNTESHPQLSSSGLTGRPSIPDPLAPRLTGTCLGGENHADPADDKTKGRPQAAHQASSARPPASYRLLVIS